MYITFESTYVENRLRVQLYDEHFVCYIQSSTITENQLTNYTLNVMTKRITIIL